MSFVRTHYYSGDKASGGLIDFSKGSLISGEQKGDEAKPPRKVRKQEKEQEFKPKELFSDRDLEYTAENLTSANAIISAFNEESLQYLEELREKRQKLWKKRQEEVEEFAKEAAKLRYSLQEDSKTVTESPPEKSNTSTSSLFSKKSSTAYVSKPVIVAKKKAIAPHSEDSNKPPEEADIPGVAPDYKRAPGVKVASKAPSNGGIDTLVDGYSSSGED
ncbi:hypothetical protein BgAZ_305270 [Babesia gibsoni]|uniref:Uncharacterized protein n=1 Tax=Babesia gibsoni TaxID=33632 RepID=A0AAD8LIU8_BABGI|nr:hypothetical protein BgAZ_305270 [Babesia gibsoni]